MADRIDRLEQWVLDLHVAQVKALRQAGIQGSKDDVDSYADVVWEFSEAIGRGIPEGTDEWFDLRRKERGGE